jgi:tyrosyl-tRNA synthetase
VDRGRLVLGVEVLDLLVETGLAPSKRAARDLVRQGGAYLNGARVDDVTLVVSDSNLQADGALLLRAGKKRFHRVVPRD